MSIFWERSNGYGIEVNEFNGNISLQAAKHKDDKEYKDWVFLSKRDNDNREFVPDDKKRPMGVYFGSKEQAIEGLRFLLNGLEGGEDAPF